MATPTTDVQDLGSASEVDSDSDWVLDMASNRGADTDPEAALDSDADPDGPLLSRRSSFDARTVDRWEGLIEPLISRPESPAFVVPPVPSSELTPHESRLAVSPLARNVLATEEDLVEDEQVRNALDQSLISTLSASRSSTTHSRSELRLSFPDPLTSSREDTLPPLRAELSLESDAFTSTDPELMAIVESDSDSEDDDRNVHDLDILTDHPVPAHPESSPSVTDVDAVLPEVTQTTPASTMAKSTAERPGKIIPVLDGLRAYHVSTILALLSIALGYMMSGTIPTSGSRALTPSRSTLALSPTLSSALQPNVSSATTPFKSVSSNALMAIPTGQSALMAISCQAPNVVETPPRKLETGLSRMSTMRSDLSVVPVRAEPVAGPSKLAVSNQAGPPSASGASAAISALSVVTPTTTSAVSVVSTTSSSLSLLPLPPSSPNHDPKGKRRAADTDGATAITTWIENALQLVLDGDRPHALCEWADTSLAPLRALAPDTDDLRRALDDLSTALAAAGQKLRTAPGPALRVRHQRARRRARGMRAKGEAWLRDVALASAGWADVAREHVRRGTETAQERARAMRATHTAERKAQRQARKNAREQYQAQRGNGKFRAAQSKALRRHVAP